MFKLKNTTVLDRKMQRTLGKPRTCVCLLEGPIVGGASLVQTTSWIEATIEISWQQQSKL